MSLETVLKMSKTLGDETRLAIYRFLSTRRQPVSVTDVASHFGLHPNAARTHLTRLEGAGLASSATDRSTPSGRPPRLYRAAFRGMAPIFEPTAYRALTLILLDLVTALPEVDEQRMTGFGRAWGRSYASRWKTSGEVEEINPGYILNGLVRTLEGWGFSAELVGERAAGKLSGLPDKAATAEQEVDQEANEKELAVVVHRCVFEDLIERHGRLVCPLILGVLEGLLSAVRPDLHFTQQRQPSHRPGCCILRLVSMPIT